MPASKFILTKSKDWTSFKRTIDALDNKQKGDTFEDLAQHFFQIDPKYRTKLKNVWNVNKREVPSRIHRKLNLPNPDLGIDLLAETAEGEFWAIQCKYHSDQSKSLTKSEIDSCMNLAFGHCKGISLAVVCTSAEKYSRHLKDYAKEKLTYCDGSVWRSLDENFFKAVRKNLKGQSQPIKALKPRPHQKRAIKNAVAHFVTKKNERGKMIMPCGSGKSLTGYWIADKFKAKKILVAVPSLALIKQTLEVWAEQSVANKKNVRWICVCSDKSVGNISNDDVAVQLQDLGIKIHTDPTEIAFWLRKRSSATTVVFTTYQSGEAIAAASKKVKYNFDLCIFDEAHKTVSRGKKGTPFSHMLHEKNINIKRRLFMTATERHYRGSTDEILSMDNQEFYGETFEKLTFKEALEIEKPGRILSDYKIITVGVSPEEIRGKIKKNILVKPASGAWNKEVEIQMLIATLALRKAMRSKGVKHAISFHSSIARAKAFKSTQDNFTKHITGFGKLDTFHVSAKVPTGEREKVLDEFTQSQRSLITNARCLTEGVDIKQVDCVVFADPKKSVVDIVQAAGRALRPYKDKKYGYIIVPYLIDAETLKGRIEQNGSFKYVLMTLRALANHDDRIVEYFREISQGKRISQGNAPVIFDFPVGEKIDYKQFGREIKLKVWSKLARLSWRPFEEARGFVRRLNLKSQSQWNIFCITKERPGDIPSNPQRVYRSQGWINWSDWLGNGVVATRERKYLPFIDARNYVHTLKLNSKNDWQSFCLSGKKPDNIPANPQRTYANDWVGWSDWVGSGRKKINYDFRPFKTARKYVRSLGLKTRRDWRIYCTSGRKPDDIPALPDVTYRNSGWINYGDWIGTGSVASKDKSFRDFKSAREYVKPLNIQSAAEWRGFRTSGKKPADIPAAPDVSYKDKGWKGWPHFLGKTK